MNELENFTDAILKLSYKQGTPCIEIRAKEKDNLTNENRKGYV